MGENEGDVAASMKDIGGHVDVKDLGDLKLFLGVSFNRNHEKAWIMQSHYV